MRLRYQSMVPSSGFNRNMLWASLSTPTLSPPDISEGTEVVDTHHKATQDDEDIPGLMVTKGFRDDIEASFRAQSATTETTKTTTSSSTLTSDMSDTSKSSQLTEYLGLGTWITSLSSFLLVNNYIGPWPANLLASIPVKAFGLTHAVAGMLFGGGIILTTLLEWLAVGSKDASVLQFYFDKVPKLDAFVVLPSLTFSILSGVGLAVDHYGSLGESPFHVVGAISTLLAFAIWWAATDVTTQGAAETAINKWVIGSTEQASTKNGDKMDVPQIVEQRKISNVISCLFVLAIYGFMVLKPGYTPPPVMI